MSYTCKHIPRTSHDLIRSGALYYIISKMDFNNFKKNMKYMQQYAYFDIQGLSIEQNKDLADLNSFCQLRYDLEESLTR